MNHDKISVGTYAKNEPASAGLRVLRILYCKKDLICLSIYLFLPSCRSAWNSGGCIISLIIALLTTHRIPENDKPGKRLWLLLLTNVLTISCDSMSCLYRGDESELGIWISQSANIAVYVLMLVFAVEFTYYLHARLRVHSAVWLYFNEAAAAIGLVLLGVTQFTGFFYFYDIHNNYLRGSGFLCFYGILVIIYGHCLYKIHQRHDRIIKEDRYCLAAVFGVLIISGILQLAFTSFASINIGATIGTMILYLWHFFKVQDLESDRDLRFALTEQKRTIKALEESQSQERRTREKLDKYKGIFKKQQDDRQKTLEVLDRSEAKAKETQKALEEAQYKERKTKHALNEEQDSHKKTIEALDRSESRQKETQQALDEARSQLEDLNAGESGKESL